MAGGSYRPVLVRLITKKQKTKNKIKSNYGRLRGVGGASALSACFLLLCIASPIPRACRTRPRVAHAPLALFWICGGGREGKSLQCAVFFWPGRHSAGSTGRTSSSPPFVHNDRLGDSNASHFLRMPYTILHLRRLPPGAFPPLWYNQSTRSIRLSMAPQRLGTPRYH